MTVVERSRDHVEDFIEGLEAVYGRVPVQQTTVSVPTYYYDRVREQCLGSVGRLEVHLHNDADEVLLVEDSSDPAPPSTRIAVRDDVATAARTVVEDTVGVACQSRGLDAVTIVGVHDEDRTDRDALYWLVTTLTCDHVAGTPTRGYWASDLPSTDLLR